MSKKYTKHNLEIELARLNHENESLKVLLDSNNQTIESHRKAARKSVDKALELVNYWRNRATKAEKELTDVKFDPYYKS